MPSVHILLTLPTAALAGLHLENALPAKMKAVQASGTPCSAPNWSCISVETVAMPRPKVGELLVQVKSSSVNPINLDLVEPLCKYSPPPFACSNGTIGNDGAGVIAGVNGSSSDHCADFKVGDEVWFVNEGSYAEYSAVPCSLAGLKPKSMHFKDAGTVGVVGQTALQCLSLAGPLSGKTVVVTSGQGGTGFMGVQLAKALGAAKVITAATGDGMEVMKKLGADTVVDFHKMKLFESLPADSVDVVFDNLGRPGTADAALPTIRKGGVFLLLQGGGGGNISNHTKAGVHQIPSCNMKPFGTSDLNTLARLFDAGKWQPLTMSPTYGLAEIPKAFTRSLAHGILGKIAVVINASQNSADIVV